MADYPHDASDEQAPPAIPSCPVDFSPRDAEQDETELLFKQFRTEFNSMYTWYTIAQEKSSRTAVGLSNLSFDEIIDLYKNLITDNHEKLQRFEPDLAAILRFGAEDLKSCYFEAISSRPDQPTDVASLSNWFWGETYAATAINEVRKKCLEYGTKEMKLAGKLLLIPRNQMHRFKD